MPERRKGAKTTADQKAVHAKIAATPATLMAIPFPHAPFAQAPSASTLQEKPLHALTLVGRGAKKIYFCRSLKQKGDFQN